jgi:hypothetical protein
MIDDHLAPLAQQIAPLPHQNTICPQIGFLGLLRE